MRVASDCGCFVETHSDGELAGDGLQQFQQHHCAVARDVRRFVHSQRHQDVGDGRVVARVEEQLGFLLAGDHFVVLRDDFVQHGPCEHCKVQLVSVQI